MHLRPGPSAIDAVLPAAVSDPAAGAARVILAQRCAWERRAVAQGSPFTQPLRGSALLVIRRLVLSCCRLQSPRCRHNLASREAE